MNKLNLKYISVKMARQGGLNEDSFQDRLSGCFLPVVMGMHHFSDPGPKILTKQCPPACPKPS